MIFFQGLEDRVVPPDQAGAAAQAAIGRVPLRAARIPSSRDDQARIAELYFCARVSDFELADSVEPVAIENL